MKLSNQRIFYLFIIYFYTKSYEKFAYFFWYSIRNNCLYEKNWKYFLKLPDIQNNKIIKNDQEKINKGIAIQITNGTFKWGVIQSSSIDDKKQTWKKSKSTEIKPVSKSKNRYSKIPNISLNRRFNINNKKDLNTLFDC